jgi:NAD(P)-dependent dehydrogenase (short-subunit alcohol dehydrogenase family)
MEISGSKAIIVGGASGMALATAEAFVAKGGKVAILDLAKSKGAEVAERLKGSFFPCNVMDYDGTEKVIGEAVKALGGVHFVVNTAGGGIAKRTITKEGEMHPLDDFRRIIDLNLIASFNVTRRGQYEFQRGRTPTVNAV